MTGTYFVESDNDAASQTQALIMVWHGPPQLFPSTS
jgi:hypothetical protein